MWQVQLPNGQQFTVTEIALTAMIRSGQVRPDTLVCLQGHPWIPAGRVTRLAPHFSKAQGFRLFPLVATGIGIFLFLGFFGFLFSFLKREQPSVSTPSTSSAPSSSAPSVSPKPPEWYEGGTLHKASIKQWKKAGYRDRLATSADFAVNISETGRFKFSTMDELKVHAIEIEKCISKAAEAKGFDDQPVSDYAATCAILMYPK